MKKITLEDARDATQLNKFTLDEDNLRQPQLMLDVSEQAAWAKNEKREAKLVVERTFAELDAQLRKAMADGSMEKMSETQIKLRITLMPKMVSAENELKQAEYVVDKWEGAFQSMESRGKTLQELGKLYAANYFSTETGGRERTQIKNDLADRAREETGRLRRPTRS